MKPDKERDVNELIGEIYLLFSSFKKRMEDPDFIQLDITLKTLVDNQREMKSDLRDFQKQLLNPYNGVIVENRKNTDFRLEHEERDVNIDKIIEEHKSLIRWKDTLIKVGYTIITAAGAIGAIFLTKFLGM